MSFWSDIDPTNKNGWLRSSLRNMDPTTQGINRNGPNINFNATDPSAALQWSGINPNQGSSWSDHTPQLDQMAFANMLQRSQGGAFNLADQAAAATGGVDMATANALGAAGQANMAGANAAGVGQNQSALANLLMAQAQGQGPSLAQNQLNAATAQNIRNMTGAIASQRGINPALAMRMAAGNAAASNQAAAGQAGNLRLQEQLGARQQLGDVLNTQRGGDLSQQNAYLSQMGQFANLGNLANQQSGALANAANIYSGMYGQGVQGQQAQNSLLSSNAIAQAQQQLAQNQLTSQNNIALMNAEQQRNALLSGNALAAQGMDLQKQMALGQWQQAQNQANAAQSAKNWGGVYSAVGDVLGKLTGIGGAVGQGQGQNATAGQVNPSTGMSAASDGKGGATGGGATGGGGMSEGGQVGGVARSDGNDPRNDVVPTRLSPGEIVIPRSITMSEHAAERAAGFVEAIKHMHRGGPGYATGGEILPDYLQDPNGMSIDPTLSSRPIDMPASPVLFNFSPSGASVAPTQSPQMDPREEAVKQLNAQTTGQPMFNWPAPNSATAQGLSAQPSSPKAAPEAAPMPAPPQKRAPQMDDFARAEKMGLSGIQSQAKAEQQEAQATASLQGEVAKWQQQFADSNAAQLAERQKRADQMRNDIMSSKVDPERFWSSRSTGQKISAGIGILLGGLGAGLQGRGDNRVLDIIDKEIDRDIDAQKTDLGKKQNLFGQYLQETRDWQSAQRLVKADHMDVVSAQLQRIAAQAADPKAAAIAEQNSAKLIVASKQLRQETALRATEIQKNQLAMGIQMRQMDALRRLASGGGRAEDLMFAPEDVRARAVKMPDGSVKLATTPADAEKIKDSIEGQTEFETAVMRATDLEKKNDTLKSLLPASWTKAGRQAEVEEGALMTAASKAIFGTEPRNLNNTDREILENMKPKIRNLNSENFAAAMDEFKRAARDKAKIAQSR